MDIGLTRCTGLTEPSWPNKTIYHEVETHKKLVYDHGGSDDRPAMFRVTVLFAEHKGKTTMDMTMALATPEALEETRKIIKKHSGNSTWDRLAEYLEKESSGKEKFVIARTFDAPLETMFEMWTDPKHFSQWLAPTGFDMGFVRADIRTGGSTFWFMSGAGMKMYGRAEYLKIEKPGTIVYTQQFCDEHEKLSRHPKLPLWPATMLTTVQLIAEGPDQTRVVVTWEPYGEATAEEIATFVNARAGMSMGWTGSCDKLEAYLTADERK